MSFLEVTENKIKDLYAKKCELDKELDGVLAELRKLNDKNEADTKDLLIKAQELRAKVKGLTYDISTQYAIKNKLQKKVN